MNDSRNNISPDSNLIAKDQTESPTNDGIDRRNFLSCMAWAGTGLLWTLSGGVPQSRLFAATIKQDAATAKKDSGSFSFVQISDSHIGFNKAANQDVAGTLRLAINKINAQASAADFMLHTGDITQSAKAAEFDTASQIIREAKVGQSFYVPGEHDTAADDGALYHERFGKGTIGSGWYSFNHKDVHFVGLSNVQAVEGLGKLGDDQLKWLARDLESQPASRPVVVFAHIPLWSVYPEWGWGTEDSAQALQLLKRFGSVTVLNGHIHQVMQKVEGAVTFHTAMSTAFPQPAPGTAKAPGPMKVPDDQLRQVLGITEVRSVVSGRGLAVVDSPLASADKEAVR